MFVVEKWTANPEQSLEITQNAAKKEKKEKKKRINPGSISSML